MREAIRKHYHCDFCKRTSHTRPAMEKHERGCTMNPDRVCGMCKLVDGDQLRMNKLKAIVAKYVPGMEDWTRLAEATAELRKVTGNCPACILAALRQSNVMDYEFNFKDEMAAFWDKYNEDERRQTEYDAIYG